MLEKISENNRNRDRLIKSLNQQQVAYQNTIWEQKVETRTQELHNSRLEIIRRLSLAAEYSQKLLFFEKYRANPPYFLV